MRGIKISQSITDRNDTSLKLYFREVSKQKMITPDEEIELAKRIKQGDKKAEDKLIRANLRFVISVAKKYQNKGLSLIDLIQEGNIGLIKSAKLYDETKGFKFISYAVWWIRQAIIKALSDQCRTVRIPMNQVVSINKINKFTEQFEQLNERKPSIDELENNINMDASKINITLNSMSKSVSLDSPISDGDDADSLLDIIPNNSEPTDNDINKKDLTDSINRVLSKLSYRDRDILRMSFGIDMLPMPNEEIARRFGIGSERVRQIQHKAVKTLKTRYSNELKDLL